MTVTATDQGQAVIPGRPLDRIAECTSGHEPTDDLAKRRYILVHRISFARKTDDNPTPIADELLDGPELAKRNKADPNIGRCAYHALIRADEQATLEQLMPLSTRGAHAYNRNRECLGVAVVGDFRGGKMPTPRQLSRLVRLCVQWAPLNSGLVIKGHDQLEGARANLEKVCPGDGLSIRALEDAVRVALPEDWRTWLQEWTRSHLVKAGWVL